RPNLAGSQRRRGPVRAGIYVDRRDQTPARGDQRTPQGCRDPVASIHLPAVPLRATGRWASVARQVAVRHSALLRWAAVLGGLVQARRAASAGGQRLSTGHGPRVRATG